MSQINAPNAATIVVFCTRCGQAMSVVHSHIHVTVACPHCAQRLEPWRALKGVLEHSPDMVSSRNKVVAGLLGILLGGVGAHRFYLGFTGIGLLQLCLTICTQGIAAIWGFVEGILCLTGHMRDVDGLPLKDH